MLSAPATSAQSSAAAADESSLSKVGRLDAGELQGQIAVTCVEQGGLSLVRQRYAEIFNGMQNMHGELVVRFARRREQEDLRAELRKVKAKIHTVEDDALTRQEKAVEEVRREMTSKIEAEKGRADQAKLQQDRAGETLRTLNGIFLQMRHDTDSARVADLRDAVSTMERRCTEREKELAELRPLRGRYDQIKERADAKELEAEDLARTVAVRADLSRRCHGARS